VGVWGGWGEQLLYSLPEVVFVSKHGLGRNPNPPDSRDWPVSRLVAMIEAGVAVPVSWVRRSGQLDQGSTGHCVGFAGANWEGTDEAGITGDKAITNATGHQLYYASVAAGGAPNSESGSCGRWLAQALQELGIIDHYAIGGFADGKAWVQRYGAVPIGTNWWSSMDQPDSNGVVTVGGTIRGGHETCWHETDTAFGNGVDNSWGAWGLNGDYRISDANLQTLIDAQGGDVLCMVKLTAPTPPTPPVPPYTPPPPPVDPHAGLPWPDLPVEYRDDGWLVKDSGLMQGYDDGTFLPGKSMPAYQIETIIARLKLRQPVTRLLWLRMLAWFLRGGK
jgi:hypothetical protein